MTQLSHQIPAELFGVSSAELRVCVYEPLETWLFLDGEGVGFDRPEIELTVILASAGAVLLVSLSMISSSALAGQVIAKACDVPSTRSLASP